MAINPEKRSGKEATLQSRQQYHDAVLTENARRQKDGDLDNGLLPVPEIIKSGDSFVSAGKKVLVDDDDINATDVRVICLANGRCTGWDKQKNGDAVIACWNAANPTA